MSFHTLGVSLFTTNIHSNHLAMGNNEYSHTLMLPPSTVVVKDMTKSHFPTYESLIEAIPSHWSIQCLCVIVAGHCCILGVAIDVDVFGRTLLSRFLPGHQIIWEMTLEESSTTS